MGIYFITSHSNLNKGTVFMEGFNTAYVSNGYFVYGYKVYAGCMMVPKTTVMKDRVWFMLI